MKVIQLLIVLLTTTLAIERAATSWFLFSQYGPNSLNCGVSAPLAKWQATSFGMCEYDYRTSTYFVRTVSGPQSISQQSYGQDSSCTTAVGGPQTIPIPAKQLGCQPAFIGYNAETYGVIIKAETSTTPPYGLPRAPFVGVGYYGSSSSTCAGSQAAALSLSNPAINFCYDSGASVSKGGDGTSYTISCVNPEKPSLILFSDINCMGSSGPMPPSHANYTSLTAEISNPTCTQNSRDKMFYKQLFCMDTAVATQSRLQFPTPVPTRPPSPSTTPTAAPTLQPTPTPQPTQTYLIADTLALCALYDTFDISKRATLTNWCGDRDAGVAPAPVCSISAGQLQTTWSGVKCQVVRDCQDSACNLDGKLRVVSLTLTGVPLGGSLPSAISDLNALTSLIIDSTSLSGSIPSQIAALHQLQYFGLPNNRVSGIVPTVLGDLLRLTTVDLHSNKLVGTIPSQLAQLTDLTSLNLASNSLGGSVPAWLGTMSKMAALNLASTNLAGDIPAALCSLTKSATIDISGAKLGCYPSCLNAFKAFSTTAQECGDPTEKPTKAPSVAATLSPSAQPSGQSINAAGAAGQMTVSTGGIAGISVALVVLCVAAVLVFRAVKLSEVDLPSERESNARYSQNNPIMDSSSRSFISSGGNSSAAFGISHPSGGEGQVAASSNRHDSIPPEMPARFVGRRDSIPMAMEAAADSGKVTRLNPNSGLNDL